jgi:peptidoglycan/xylan/chitin deacetylase (PgdA/CDA1 family)
MVHPHPGDRYGGVFCQTFLQLEEKMNSDQTTESTELLAPDTYRWPDGKRVAVNFLVAYEGWSEGRTPGIGPMGNPLPPNTMDRNSLSWGEYGHRRGIWRILRSLERYKIPASIMVCGVLAERYPDSVRAIADGGHEIIAHSYAMDVLPVLLSEEQERENIERTTALIEAAAGVRPVGWISPRLTPSASTGRLLAEAGYLWHGDSLNDDLPSLVRYDTGTIVNIPFQMVANDLPLAMRYGNPPSQFVDVFKSTFDYMMSQSDEVSKIDVTVHAHAFGRPYGIWTYEEVIRMAKAAQVYTGKRQDIAAHFRTCFPATNN